MGCPPCAFLKMPHELSVQFRANETLFVRARGIRLLSDARFGSFLRSKACGEIKFPNGYLVSLLLLSVLIKILAKVRLSIYFCSLKFSKIPTLDDWTIAIFLVLDKQKTDWNSTEIRKFVNRINEIFTGVFLYVTRIVCSIFRRNRNWVKDRKYIELILFSGRYKFKLTKLSSKLKLHHIKEWRFVF